MAVAIPGDGLLEPRPGGHVAGVTMPRAALVECVAGRPRGGGAGMHLSREIGRHAAPAPFLVEETRPGLDARDDDALLDYIQRRGATSYHPVGTCRMGTDADSVVDTACRVRGVDGLRVIDASVMPFIVSSNTNAPSMAIGARGAELLLAEGNA